MKDNYIFIHIGKCAGSFISKQFPQLNRVHMHKPKFRQDQQYIIWIRNPIKRFVSAFNHSKSLIEYQLHTDCFDEIYNEKSSPYYRLKNKINSKLLHNCPFAEWESGFNYEFLMNKFNSPNQLAESLTSNSKSVKNQAIELMSNTEVEHINKGLGWYLQNGDFVKHHHDSIKFVGRVEYISEDLGHLSKLLGTPVGAAEKEREGYIKQIQSLTLSSLAITNIKKFYEKTDYYTLKSMLKYKLIDTQTYEDYLSLD